MKNILKLAISLLVCMGAGGIGSIFTTPEINNWYAGLNKPSFTPPGAVIGAVWTVLYVLMGISFYLVWKNNWEVKTLPPQNRKTWNRFSDKLLWGDWRKVNIIVIFAIQLFLNILWSFIFFTRHLPGLAFFELLMLWVAVSYTLFNFARVSKLAAYLLIPYILWVSFAGFLNFALWQLNP